MQPSLKLYLARPTLHDLNPDDLFYYPFMINLDPRL